MAKQLRELKYPNLLAEMRRHGETQDDLGELLGLCRTTINFKLSGKYDWTIGEIEIICNHYEKDYYELFK